MALHRFLRIIITYSVTIDADETDTVIISMVLTDCDAWA